MYVHTMNTCMRVNMYVLLQVARFSCMAPQLLNLDYCVAAPLDRLILDFYICLLGVIVGNWQNILPQKHTVIIY